MIKYDAKTLRAMFGKPMLPTIPVTQKEIAVEAQKVAGKLSISGMQPKLSVRLEGDQLVSVAEKGLFILKPQTQNFPELPQNEYLCMQMGQRFGLRTAACLLLELSDQTPAYLVKRFDRYRKGRRIEKLACEDMHQVLGGPDKYAGSHEQIAEAIQQHCTFAPLEIQRFFETTLFNFAIGNGDAHRKNFSLLTNEGGNVGLSPAYDLVSSRLAIPEEKEQLALTVNGKRNRLQRRDFLDFASHIGVASAYAEKRVTDLLGLQDEFAAMIDNSIVSEGLHGRFGAILAERMDRLR